MARKYRSTQIEVTASVDVSDVLQEISTEQLVEELEGRDDYVVVLGQAPADAVFLEDLARTLEIGRTMDAAERRLAALKLREMIAPDQQRSNRAAEVYAKWQAEQRASR